MVSFRPSLIRSRSCSSGAYLVLSLSVFSLSFRFLSSASVPVPATRPLFLPFLFLPVSASQRLPRCALSAFASLTFPRSFRPDFPCLLSRFFVLGFLFVSFRPSRLRSHSCSTGASLMLSLSGFPLPICFLINRFSSGSDYLASVSSFPLLPCLASQRLPQVLPLCLSASLLFHFRSTRFPLLSFRFKYSVLCNSFLRSLFCLTVATSAPPPSSFRFPAFSPWLSL